MESTKKRPHQALSLEKKLQILQELDRSGLSKTEVAKKFNIPKSTLSRILKNKETIEGAVKNGTFTSKRMRMRTTPQTWRKRLCGVHAGHLPNFENAMDYSVEGEKISPEALQEADWKKFVSKRYEEFYRCEEREAAERQAIAAIQQLTVSSTSPAAKTQQNGNTPRDEHAQLYLDLPGLRINNVDRPVMAYLPAPDNAVRGVIYGALGNKTAEEIIQLCILENTNLQIFSARLMGLSRAIVITFAGAKLPRIVKLQCMPFNCFSFKERIETCYNCRRTGHTADICYQPPTQRCHRCGEEHPPPPQG
ncbi:hypothetical protein HPB50_020129 [Hyalomma asiaticum]|uniref:Uncharacterized protein n=1 Tax=Hyalomma asiaticum TaxID=266040 RepID=A0ACB7S0W3_HYAAI|nr:hypothetical protein HPB50_020129 [Hyalomma asiaticum]